MLIYRAEYNPDQYLWETEFTLGGRKFRREDVEASMEIKQINDAVYLAFTKI